MTKKDYELIAEVFAAQRPRKDQYNKIECFATADYKWRDLAETMARRLWSNNPKFQTDKFLTACGIEVWTRDDHIDPKEFGLPKIRH